MTQIDIVDPWIKETDLIPCDYPVPDNALDKLRYRVFEDFHSRRKYFLSSGLKFGGDFLAYPGDPNATHSEFIIVCHDNSRSINPPYIHSQIRLATTVKKILLLATFDESKEKLKYKVMNSLQLTKKQRLNARTESHVNDTEMCEPNENNEISTAVDASAIMQCSTK
ncbi:tRNA-splicing endonuclease subunit Sen34 [Orchesella cincta]|uniref:tRNA-intron lyase n=1 Tax=Orchesella cincta TaxID=48709 RepID=A0A1D2MM13_ORCCI|nr:tRNA-splicing endonuclease subunit Sen34 [Orchesella cincta]